jgi:hypothetical protein
MKTRLVETTIIGPNEYTKSNFLNESDQTVFIEKTGEPKKEYKAKAIYTFPISRPGKENLNGRVYNEKLWKNSVKRLADSSTFGLMDHPQEEGSTKDIWCVWRNLRFSEAKDTVVADAYLIGKWGEMVKEILEAGGKVGLSTSGYGEFLEDHKTIDPDSYELERVADFVFNPSYEVYGSQENIISQEESTEKDGTMKINEEIIEDLKEENTLIDKKPEDPPVDNDKKEPIETPNNHDKKKPTSEAAEDPEEKEDDEKEKEKDEACKKKESDEEDPGEKKDSEEDKKEESAETFKCPDCGGKVLSTSSYCLSCKKKVKNPDEKDDKKDDEKEKKDDKKESFLAKSFRLNMVSSFKQAQKLEAVSERIDQYSELLSYFEEGIAEDLKKEIEEALFLDEKLVKESSNPNEMNILKQEVEALRRDKGAVEEKLNNSLELLDSLKTYSKKLKEMYDLVQAEKNGMVTASEYREAQVYLETVEHEKELLESEVIKLKSKLSEKATAGPTSRVEEDVLEEKEEDKVEEKTLESANPEVQRYYTNLEYDNPSVVLIKEDILRCRTLMEAQRTFLKLKSLYETSESAYDRKVTGPKSSYLESSSQRLPIRDNWL